MAQSNHSLSSERLLNYRLSLRQTELARNQARQKRIADRGEGLGLLLIFNDTIKNRCNRISKTID